MTPNRLTAIAFRWSISAVFTLWLFAPHAQAQSAATVALSVCNAGKVDIDVFVAKEGKVSSSHIGAADCARVYSENRGVPAYVGLALVDSHGQWGTARRLDLLPDFGGDVLTRADKNVSVRRGDKEVPAQLQLLFRPRNPTCRSPAPSHAAQDNLPLYANGTQRLNAQLQDQDQDRVISSLGGPCETLGYVLNVVAYPDSREITFNKFCEPCDKKAEARITPEERAGRQRREDAVNQEIGKLRATGPLGALVMGNAVNQAKQQAQKEEREREQERPAAAERMNWNDLLVACARARTGNPVQVPKNILIGGTVSRVDVTPDPFEPTVERVNIYFKESPDGAFNVCSTRPDIFQDMFGPDFRSRMIGKTLEVEGAVTRAYCKGYQASIRITLARQVHAAGGK
jgi:hypothetical protein